MELTASRGLRENPYPCREGVNIRASGSRGGAGEDPDAARLGLMTPRNVPVNWDDLEMALTTNPGEFTCYLDVRDGAVQMLPIDRFDEDDDWPSEEEIDTALAAGHLIHVEPLGSSVEYGWMEDFVGTLGNARLRDLLEVALAGRGAFRRFKDVLLAYPVEREAWFAFRDGHVRAAARDWLEENGIDPTTAPPRRRAP